MNRHPNCKCVDCGKPLYRRPNQLVKVPNPRCRPCWREWNRQRDMSHLWTPETIQKRKRYGPENPCWRGGRYVEPEKGYVMVRCPPEFQPMARQNGYVLEHRLVVAQHLERCLVSGEVVHHRNGDLEDNRPENLRLYSSHQAHYSQQHAAEIAAENSRTGRTDWRRNRVQS